MWLPDSEKSLTISLAVSTQYRRVTDGRTLQTDTDRQTDSIVSAMHSIAQQNDRKLREMKKSKRTYSRLQLFRLLIYIFDQCQKSYQLLENFKIWAIKVVLFRATMYRLEDNILLLKTAMIWLLPMIALNNHRSTNVITDNKVCRDITVAWLQGRQDAMS